MEMKIKDGLIARGLCTVIERVIRKRYGFNPIIFLDELTITEDSGTSHIKLNVSANIDTKDLNKIILSTVK